MASVHILLARRMSHDQPKCKEAGKCSVAKIDYNYDIMEEGRMDLGEQLTVSATLPKTKRSNWWTLFHCNFLRGSRSP